MKLCRKCTLEKPLAEYYKHKPMADGHLNICKECTKKRIHGYWADGRGKEVDRKRQKKPARKKWQSEYAKKINIKYAKKRQARVKFWNEFRHGTIKKLPCEWCGTEDLVQAHHYDYNKPFEVMWLCTTHHRQWHRENTAIT